jgi:phospholipid/cholesterol/gamma-HCH transport system ATP-binding protein
VSDPQAAASPMNDAEREKVYLRVVDLKKGYGENQILKGVTIDIDRGKNNIIIGASGSGKTVFTRQIMRLERPDSGQILVDGTDIARMSDIELVPVRKKLGIVFQMGAIFDSMSVYDNVAFMLREHTKLNAKAIREKVMERLETLGIAHAEKRMSSELSGGMRKRVSIARALVMEPELLIYDEPTTGLDPITSRTVDDLIEEMREKFGVTSIVITHDMETVFRIGHRIHYLYKGLIDMSGTQEEFLASEKPRVKEFLAASGVNLDRGQ